MDQIEKNTLASNWTGPKVRMFGQSASGKMITWWQEPQSDGSLMYRIDVLQGTETIRFTLQPGVHEEIAHQLYNGLSFVEEIAHLSLVKELEQAHLVIEMLRKELAKKEGTPLGKKRGKEGEREERRENSDE